MINDHVGCHPTDFPDFLLYKFPHHIITVFRSEFYRKYVTIYCITTCLKDIFKKSICINSYSIALFQLCVSRRRIGKLCINFAKPKIACYNILQAFLSALWITCGNCNWLLKIISIVGSLY